VKGSKDPNAKRIRFNIETKVFPDHPEYTIDPKEFSEKAVAAFKKSGFYDRIILQSFDPRTLVEGKKIDPKLVTVLLVEDPKMDMIAEAKKINANIISPDFTLLNADLVEKMHQAHFQVVPWTVNEEKDWASLVQMKVDGIISDYCDRVIAYLEKTGHRDAKAKKAHFAFF
jgi:glycerophosphoryl diester phosphodiesterase